MSTLVPPTALPNNDADPFSDELLENPLPLHEALREAGPISYLSLYGVYALARYEHVRAALSNWQDFQSSAGVGLSNFRREKPWRPPSLLLEADPPRHDAPRRVLSKILGPRALHTLREGWIADATALVDTVLADGPEFDAVTALAQAFRCASSPTLWALVRKAGRTSCPTVTICSTRSAPPTALSPMARRANPNSARGPTRNVSGKHSRTGGLAPTSGLRPIGARSPTNRRPWSYGRCCRPASTPRCTACRPRSSPWLPIPCSGNDSGRNPR